jgi:2-keto-4-pentenoate hydratase
MLAVDVRAIAQELLLAHASGQIVQALPSSRDPSFDLSTAYAVEAEVARLRRASGRATVGRKVGFANKALWRVLKLETLVWAHMYDDTVRYAHNNVASLSLKNTCSPKIEPEIVFKMKRTVSEDEVGPAAVLEAVEWLALGFEIIDCNFAAEKFQPADFVADCGFHSALIVGAPRRIEPEVIPALVDQLARFKVSLLKDRQLVDQGSGKNALRSPAACLSELVSAISRQPSAAPLAAGELVSSGTLTESQRISPGETWTAILDGLGLPDLTLHTTA